MFSRMPQMSLSTRFIVARGIVISPLKWNAHHPYHSPPLRNRCLPANVPEVPYKKSLPPQSYVYQKLYDPPATGAEACSGPSLTSRFHLAP